MRGKPVEGLEGRRQIEENAMNEHTDRAQDRITITASRGFRACGKAHSETKG